MPNRMNVMSHGNRGASVAVLINKFIVRLENELSWVERDRAVRVHAEMGHGLIGEEIGRVVQHSQSLESKRPIQRSKQK